MTLLVHNADDELSQIVSYYERAKLNYVSLFIMMYASYNAWYRNVTSSLNDREALNALKKRYIIWDDYCHGLTMQSLMRYMDSIVELTHREPLAMSSHQWNGELKNNKDWRSLIEYWYQIRCLVVHGSIVQHAHVWLAYETLNIFMSEIIKRAHESRYKQSKSYCRSDISEKHTKAVGIKQVDMLRVS